MEVLWRNYQKFEHEYAKEEHEKSGDTLSFAWDELFKKESLYIKSLLDPSTKNMASNELELLFRKILGAIALGGVIPLALVQIANLMLDYRNLIRKIEDPAQYASTVKSCHLMLESAITQGPFKYLKEPLPKTLAPEDAKQLNAIKMDLQLGLLYDAITSVNINLAFHWQKKLKSSYDAIIANKESVDRYLDATTVLANYLFGQDPSHCREAFHTYEQLFLKACEHQNSTLALSCLSAIEVQSYIFSNTPILIDLIMEAFRRNRQMPNPIIMANSTSIMLLIGKTNSLLRTAPYSHLNQYGLPKLLKYLNHILIPHSYNIENLQKQIKTPAYLKKIKDLCFEGFQLAYKCLHKLEKLPKAPLLETLYAMRDQVTNLPRTLCTYFPPEEIAVLEKACLALVTPWDLKLVELSLQSRLKTIKAREDKRRKH
jgi:hypothetical protein